ncbi:MAG: ester cyclase [Chloroflexi bacterium]|nr:ester cyclase [Chloroflexota bacterium]
MTVEDNIRVVRRLTDEVWTEGNLDVADEIIAPAGPNPGHGMIEAGPEALKEQVGEIRAAFAPLRREVHNVVANESLVTVHSTLSGTHSAHIGLFPYPVTGAEVSMKGVATFRVVDGLIVEEPWSSWNYGDIAGPLATGAVRRYVADIWNAGNPDLLSEFVTEDHVRHQPGGDIVGIDALSLAITALRAGFPDLQFDATVIPANDTGKTVTRRWVMTGTHEGVYAGIPPTGRAVTSSGIGVSRFDGGKIAEEWISRDDLGLLAQLRD